MSKRMLINIDVEESRAAIVEDGKLVNLEIETINRNSVKGNIYKAVVAKVEPSLQAAFVDFGANKQGFLPLPEVHTRYYPKGDKRPPIQAVLKPRQELLVQVVRDEIGEKGATLTTYVSLPGRYLVLMPDSDRTGISRKLSDGDRDRLKDMADGIRIPDGFGLIVRTAGETSTKPELAKDLAYLTRMWETIERKYQESKGPTLIHAERSLAIRFVRDYFTSDIEEILVDDPGAFGELEQFLEVLMPRHKSLARLYDGSIPLFLRYDMERPIEDVYNRRVYLHSGGSIVIDQTEALVAIDVNSGRVKEKDIEETALRTNVEAAQEIARQCILRDLGGLVIIDFIDMRERKNVRQVEDALRDAFKVDKARIKLGHISEFGLLEMSRQRLKSTVAKGSFLQCQHCSGTGVTRTVESTGMSVLRRVSEAVAKGNVRYVITMVPPPVANFLLNRKRSDLSAIENEYHATVEVVAVDGMVPSQMVMEFLQEVPGQTGQERAEAERFTRVTQMLDVVRNEVVRREEAKLSLSAARPQGKAAIDYQQLYRDVHEATASVRDTSPTTSVPTPPPMPIVRPADLSTPLSTPAFVPPPPPGPAPVRAADAPRDEEYKRGGIGSWFRSLFGMADRREPEAEPPPPARTVPTPLPMPAVQIPPLPALPPEVIAPLPAAPPSTPALAAPAPRQGLRGGRSPSGTHARADRSGPPAARPQRPQRASTAVVAPTAVAEIAETAEDGEGEMDANGKRRRGRRGGRRRRRGPEEGQAMLAEALDTGATLSGAYATEETPTVVVPTLASDTQPIPALDFPPLPEPSTDEPAPVPEVRARRSRRKVGETGPVEPAADKPEQAEVERKARLEEARAAARAEIERLVSESQAPAAEAPIVPAEPEPPAPPMRPAGRFVIDLRRK